MYKLQFSFTVFSVTFTDYLHFVHVCVTVFRIESRELHLSRAMIFAIEQINNSTKLLPGIRLGYQIHDSCASVPMAVKVALQLSNGLDPVFYTNDNCSQSGMVKAIVGESGSGQSIGMLRVTGSFNIPQVSIFLFKFKVCTL